MGIKSNLYARWIKFLATLESRIKQILEKHEIGRPDNMDANPLNLDEIATFEYEDAREHTRAYYLARLDKLKNDVKKTVSYNESKLTYHQILELEEIKYNLRVQ